MFRTVLVHVESQRNSAPRTALAIDLARQFDASLIGITAGLPRLPIEIYDAGLGTVAVGPDYTEFDRQHLMAEFGKAEAAFRKAAEGSGLELDWRAVFGPPSSAIVAAAVAADIVVVGAGDRSLLGDLGAASAGDVVLRTGRPVLVAPEDRDSLPLRNILVTWKDSSEAQRAIADALPFMKRASTVTVVAVSDEKERPSGLDDAVAFLVRHGVAARGEVLPTKSSAVEDVILGHARHTGADLIVAGAYGHSRFREWAFGGVTRTLLQESPVPCLFSH
jgi:nucleotide-binding universal stress UspA family protein